MLTFRTLAAFSLFFLAAACGDARGGPIGSSSAELSATFDPAFVVATADACSSVPGASGEWTSAGGAWILCNLGETVTIDGCGYAWSSPTAAAPDVDALAGATGSGVRQMFPLPSGLGACPHMAHPNPGSTPCGACQVGVATQTHVYVSLPSSVNLDEETTIDLQTDSSLPYVSVVAPAHTYVFSEALSLPSDFAGGVTLSYGSPKRSFHATLSSPAD